MRFLGADGLGLHLTVQPANQYSVHIPFFLRLLSENLLTCMRLHYKGLDNQKAVIGAAIHLESGCRSNDLIEKRGTASLKSLSVTLTIQCKS